LEKRDELDFWIIALGSSSLFELVTNSE